MLIRHRGCRWTTLAILFGLFGLIPPGCGSYDPTPLSSLFLVPLEINGASAVPAIVDTGGDFEVLLREDFGLAVVGEGRVLAYGGEQSVSVTEGFRYLVNGVEREAPFALIGPDLCDCNGVGFRFFRETGLVLALDFSTGSVRFDPQLPDVGAELRFVEPPPYLSGFPTSFIFIEVAAGFDPPEPGAGQTITAILDTGASVSVGRREMLESLPGSNITSDGRVEITIGRVDLGVVGASIVPFDTQGLPDLILGVDVMEAWGDRWFFQFRDNGGVVMVQRDDEGTQAEAPVVAVRHPF